MFKNSLMFAMKDSGQDRNMVTLQTEKESREYNFNMYGIFFSINGFKDRRIKENLTNVNAWAVDIDKIDKDTQIKIITRSPIPPSLIIESKNGYHVYWLAKDGTKENYKEIVEFRLIPFFQADIRAKDICRILRMPGYFHWKDENDPFLIQEVFRNDHLYSEREMLLFFPNYRTKSKSSDLKFTEEYDNRDALSKLSGKHEVKGEAFDFVRNANGTWQITVNGKKTSSWIDKQGYIGSYDRGGCTWIQWLKWYNFTGKEAIMIGQRYGIRTESV
jgi:hypothetical protein